MSDKPTLNYTPDEIIALQPEESRADIEAAYQSLRERYLDSDGVPTNSFVGTLDSLLTTIAARVLPLRYDANSLSVAEVQALAQDIIDAAYLSAIVVKNFDEVVRITESLLDLIPDDDPAAAMAKALVPTALEGPPVPIL